MVKRALSGGRNDIKSFDYHLPVFYLTMNPEVVFVPTIVTKVKLNVVASLTHEALMAAACVNGGSRTLPPPHDSPLHHLSAT